MGVPTGHDLVVLHGDVIHFLAPVERRVIWTRPLDNSNGLGGDTARHRRRPTQPVSSGSQFAARSFLLIRSAHRGMLAAANTEYVAIYGRREFIVLDAETGELAGNAPTCRSTRPSSETKTWSTWSRRTARTRPPSAHFRRETACGGQAGDLLVTAVAVTPRGLVTVDGASGGILGLEAPRTVVRLVDPISKREFWKLDYPGGTRLSLLDDTRMLAIDGTGHIESVDLASGDVLKFEQTIPVSVCAPRATFSPLPTGPASFC